MAEIQESMVESVVKRGMSDQSNPQADVEAGQDPGFGATGERFVPLDGVGSLLFEMHSNFFTAPLFEEVKTSLQFYEHVVVATVSKKLWCFPKRSNTNIIPRFKIVDCTFTLGPRLWVFELLLLLSIILIIIGSARGGCKSTNSSSAVNYDLFSHYATSNNYNSGACASLVIGSLMLVACLVSFVLILFFVKVHHVRLYTLAARKRGLFESGVRTYDFRLKEIGFQHAVDNKATFDQFYLFDYICKPFSKQSADEMTEYHLFSHFNHVDLAKPIEYDVGRNHRVPDMIHRRVRQHHNHPSAHQYSA